MLVGDGMGLLDPLRGRSPPSTLRARPSEGLSP